MLTALSGKEDAALLQLGGDPLIQGSRNIHAGVSADPLTEDLAGGAAYDKQSPRPQMRGIAELCDSPLSLFSDWTELRILFHGDRSFPI